LKFEEFQSLQNQTIYISATPANFEIEEAEGVIVEQIIRPTGLLDPPVEIHPAKNQVDDLLEEIDKVVSKKERVLVTTLTKRMAEELSRYLTNVGINNKYIHSDIETLERVEIMQELREGVFDVLIGVNLLREGLDLPEVSLVAILDADKEGFLRSDRALIQTIGRAARNVSSKAILYADTITDSMKRAIAENTRNREKQQAYNEKHGIVPKQVKRTLANQMVASSSTESKNKETNLENNLSESRIEYSKTKNKDKQIKNLEKLMKQAAEELNFLDAAKYRDEIKRLKENK
jgi:excinuclease ABC subunit B